MNSNAQNKKKLVTDYKRLTKLLENNYKYLLDANANSDLLKNYKYLLQYLKSRKEDEISLIIAASNAPKESTQIIEFSDTQIDNLGFEKIKALLEDKNTSRKTIELIAIRKLNMTNSEVKSMRNKQNLIDQIFSIIENAKTHDSIKRIASKQ